MLEKVKNEMLLLISFYFYYFSLSQLQTPNEWIHTKYVCIIIKLYFSFHLQKLASLLKKTVFTHLYFVLLLKCQFPCNV